MTGRVTTTQASAVLTTASFGVGAHLCLAAALTWLSLCYFTAPGQAAFVWPANGVVLALALRSRPGRLVPVLALSTLAVATGVLLAGQTLRNALLSGLCNVGETALVTLALRRVADGAPDLTRFRDLMLFAAFAVVAPLVSGAAATGLFVGFGAPSALPFLKGWWFANGLGLLIATPAALTVYRPGLSSPREARRAWARPVAGAAVLAVMAANTLFPVGAVSIGGLAILALVGAEYGAGAAAASLLLVSTAVLARRVAGASLADLPTEQAWLAAQSLVVLALTSLVAEQRRLQAELAQRLGQSEAERLAIADSDRLARLAGAVAQIGYWRTDFRTGETVWSDAMLEILGLPQDEAGRRLDIQTAIRTCVIEADQAQMFRLSEILRAGGEPWSANVRVRRPSDGTLRRLSLRGEPELTPEGALAAVLCVGRDVTAEADARAALEESEARFRMVTQNIHDPVLHLSLDGEIRFASNAIHRYGYEMGELEGRNASEFIHPDDLPGFADFVRQLPGLTTLDGLDFTSEFRIRTASGDYVWVEGKPSLILDAEGRVDGYVNGLRDVTSRRKAEAALLESEARYRVLAEASPDLVIRCDLDLRLEYASPRLADYGYDLESVLGRSIEDMIHPADRRFVALRIREGLERGEMDLTLDRTHRMLTAAGATIWVESRPSIIRSASGEPVAILAQVRDVTERRAQLKALEDSELRYRTIAERVTDIITVAGVDGQFRYLSPAIEAATGYAPEELVGDVWSRHVHPDDRDAAAAAYLAIARGEPDAATEIRYRARRRDGTWVWLESRPAPKRGEDGRLESVIDVIRDVSRHVELETDLRSAKEAAERAALAKSEFLANMSHEIRTPLTAVLGFVGVLTDRQDLSEDSRLDLERIDHAGRTLLSIVNDILEVSKLDAGQVMIKRAPCDVRRLTADLIDMFAPQARARGLSLSLEVSDAVPPAVLIDADRVRQVAVNLIGNALKFTDRGAVRVEVDHTGADGRLVLRVRDTGPGLDAQQMAVLFKRFSQVNTSVTRRQGGTGLGLAICRGLADAMEGDIGVESAPGAGACFQLRTPAPPCAPQVQEPIPQPDFDGVSLLVVDDNASNRDLAARIFVNLGFRVDVAASGLEGVVACEDVAYDLILMDIRMPDVDGPSAARRIREGAGLSRNCPIIAFTADVDAGLDQRFPGLFSGMVRKPIEPAQLISAVAAVLPASPGAATAERLNVPTAL